MTKVSQEAGERIGQDSRYDRTGSVTTNVADGFTMVAVGDLIITRPLTKSHIAGFREVLEVFQRADVTFGNLETNVFDIRYFNGSPQAEYGGAYHVSLPELGPDLRAMGFSLLSRANNHSLDWGLEGMRETSRILDQNAIIHAGVGENLAQARAARFLETARGRVALVSFASTFTPLSRAADPAGEAPGRPGVNSLRLKRTVVVPEDLLDGLRRVRDALPDSKPTDENAKEVVLAGTKYATSNKPGYSYEADAHDVTGILQSVRSGKQFADFCIATNHGHEPGNWSQYPPDYERLFAHNIIDAGADAYVVHGPHQLRGVEIYRDRPIFYGLGNFIMDDLRTPVGADMYIAYGKDPRVDTDADVTAAEMTRGYASAPALSDPVFYESVVTVAQFQGNQLSELLLYPIELGHSNRLANRGVPRLASGRQARAILERLQFLSIQFETQIEIEGEIGIIKLR
ncbi:CapA family protein [Bradyrhizobium elkanii]|uniref:CapA family protein n=1 Tax=Bradyrhizobium elkanii TaxID=29448 RepID=UPI001BA65C64|nr:CapA family protein [Bradyrhizobium elkanii]MBR1165059.1 CapA family protein [Bradyrhizobium elkanii]